MYTFICCDVGRLAIKNQHREFHPTVGFPASHAILGTSYANPPCIINVCPNVTETKSLINALSFSCLRVCRDEAWFQSVCKSGALFVCASRSFIHARVRIIVVLVQLAPLQTGPNYYFCQSASPVWRGTFVPRFGWEEIFFLNRSGSLESE